MIEIQDEAEINVRILYLEIFLEIYVIYVIELENQRLVPYCLQSSVMLIAVGNAAPTLPFY